MTISNEAFMFKKILDTGEYNHMQMVHVLLYLETRVIGYGMAKEYMKNPVEGEQKLMQYMNHCFPKDVLPDYSPLGYSKETILKTAEQFVEERDELLKPHYQKSL